MLLRASLPIRVCACRRATLSQNLQKRRYSKTDFDTAKLLVQHLDKLSDAGDSSKQKYYSLQAVHERMRDVLDEVQDLQEMSADPDFANEVTNDLETLKIEVNDLLDKSSQVLVSTRQFDKQDAVMEVIAGAGGQEAGVFAHEILNLYLNYVHYLGFDSTITEKNLIDASGKTAGIAAMANAKVVVEGTDVFSRLKYECGVHRVQRVPLTGSKSDRLQTSTCSVAVYPKPKESDKSLILTPKDLEITFMRSSGKGGQNVNKNDTACRVVHLPTGLFVKCQEERYANVNKDRALMYIRDIVYNKMFEEEFAKANKHRKSQIGNMDRNEKIRSYNAKRNMITDHRLGDNRIVSNLEDFLSGQLGFQVLSDFHGALETIDMRQALESHLQEDQGKNSR